MRAFIWCRGWGFLAFKNKGGGGCCSIMVCAGIAWSRLLLGRSEGRMRVLILRKMVFFIVFALTEGGGVGGDDRLGLVTNLCARGLLSIL